MSIKKTLLKNTSFNLIGYVYLTIAAFISIPILLRNFGQELYGVYLLFSGIIPLMVAIDFGLSQATTRYLSLPKNSDKKRSVIWQTSFTLFFLVGLLIAAISFISFYFFASKSSVFSSLPSFQFLPLSIAISLILLFNHLNISLMTLIQSNQRFDIYNLRVLIVGTGNTLLTAFISTFTTNLVTIFFFLFSCHFITFLIFLRYACRHFSFSLPKFILDKVYSKKLFSFGLRQFVGNLASQINIQVSKYILGLSLAVKIVPVFSIPQNVMVKGTGVVSQLTLAFFPLSASLVTKEKIKKLSRLVVGLQFSILFIGILQVLFIYTLGDDVLHLWLNNPDFVVQAYPILKVLSWYFLLTTITPIPTAVLDSINRPQVPSFFAVLTAILTLGSMLYLVPSFGALGAAYAYVFASAITVPLFLFVFYRAFSKYIKKTLSSV